MAITSSAAASNCGVDRPAAVPAQVGAELRRHRDRFRGGRAIAMADTPADSTQMPRRGQFIHRTPEPLREHLLRQPLRERAAAGVSGADEQHDPRGQFFHLIGRATAPLR